MPNDAHVQAVKAVMIDAPEVKEAANRLALMALAEAESILRYGNPELKIRVIHSLLPAISSMLRQGETDTRYEELKDKMFRMFGAMGLPKELLQAQES